MMILLDKWENLHILNCITPISILTYLNLNLLPQNDFLVWKQTNKQTKTQKLKKGHFLNVL